MRGKHYETETPLSPEAVSRWLEFTAKVVSGITDPIERQRWREWAKQQDLRPPPPPKARRCGHFDPID